jgi:hypothetical protein
MVGQCCVRSALFCKGIVTRGPATAGHGKVKSSYGLVRYCKGIARPRQAMVRRSWVKRRTAKARQCNAMAYLSREKQRQRTDGSVERRL